MADGDCYKSNTGEKKNVLWETGWISSRGYRNGDVTQLVEHRTGTPLTQVRFPGAARNLSPRVNFQRRLSYGVRTPPCAMACINIYAHVEDPVVHVRVRWTMETLQHSACTVAWVARLCCRWLFRGKQPECPMGEILVG